MTPARLLVFADLCDEFDRFLADDVKTWGMARHSARETAMVARYLAARDLLLTVAEATS